MSEWISVDTRLPRTTETVLVKLKSYPRAVTAFYYADMARWNINEVGWTNVSVSDSTYWMKLPEPPK